jgi:hypothetical protein
MATLHSQEFTANGTFNVPVGVTAVWLTMIGGGGGGASDWPPNSPFLSNGGGGGGAAEFCRSRLIAVPSGGTVPITIGAGGAGAVLGNLRGVHGGTSMFGSAASADGGWGGVAAGQGNPHVVYHPELQPLTAAGGADMGGDGGGCYDIIGGSIQGNVVGAPGGYMAGLETSTYQGGSSGSAGEVNFTAAPGGIAEATPGGVGGTGGTPTFDGGGGGGGSSPWGSGGIGGASHANGSLPAATAYGTGGGGSGGQRPNSVNTGAAGRDGYCVVFWSS